jgi:hypothetical protein
MGLFRHGPVKHHAAGYGKATITFTTADTNTSALIYASNPAYNGLLIFVDDIFLSEPVAANWQRADIGSIVLAGDSGQRGDQFVLRGSGADVSGTADAFHFVYQTLTGDGRITARVLKFANVIMRSGGWSGKHKRARVHIQSV